MKNLHLRNVRVKNFKAVRDSGNVEFGSLTAFIGNNGSGKSSLIEGLEAYCDTVISGVDAAFERWLGVQSVWNKAVEHNRRATRKRGDTYDNPIAFQLSGRWGRGNFTSLLELAPEVVKNRVRIENEFLKIPQGRVYRRNHEGRSEAYNDKKLERVRKVQPGESAAPQDWSNHLRRWQFLRLNPEAMGAPYRARAPSAFPVLDRSGANIGEYLLSFHDTSPDAFNDLFEALRCVLPYARDLQAAIADAIERRIYLELTEQDFKVPGWLLSTGTLRVVALLACLRHPDPPPILIVEEIENGLDPSTVHLVVEEIRAAITAGTTQIILTTHSPYLLDLLDLSHIVIVEREQGQPIFRRPDAKQLAEWTKSFSPGALYTMGRLTRGAP